MATNQRGPVTLIPEDDADFRDYHPDDDAATVTMTNLEEEIRQTEGLMVTVNKVVGGPNQPMGHCFKQNASNFPMLDDLKEYVQKHFGPGDYRAFYRVGNKIKYNIPFTVSPVTAQPTTPLVQPQANNSEIREFLAYLRERDERQQQHALVQQPPVNPMQQIKDTLEIIKPFLPAQGTAPASPGGLMEGFQQFREMRDYFKQELSGLPADGGEATPWWADALKEAARSVGPVLAGIMAAAQARGAARGTPGAPRDVTPATPVLPPQETPPMDTDPQQAAIQILAPFADRLGQLDMAAKMMSPADKCAVAVLDQTPEEALPVLEGLANPSNRDHALAAVFHYVPAARDRFAWWDAFMQAIYADLTAPSETETLTPSNPG